MASGVGLHPACIEEYKKLQLGKKTQYIIYTLNADKTEIVVERTVARGDNQTYDDFVTTLPQDDCRWAVYDFDFEKDGGKRNKIVFFSWSPDDAKIKAKMLFASSKDALRRALTGIGAEVQATDFDEVSYENVLSKVQRGN